LVIAKRKVYHVVPGKGGGWNVKKEGGKNPSGHFDKKSDAVGRGKELAKSGPLGQIKIHCQDGKIPGRLSLSKCGRYRLFGKPYEKVRCQFGDFYTHTLFLHDSCSRIMVRTSY